MRPVLTWATLAIALLAGCSFDGRSDQYACDQPSDCTDGRVCLDGFCVFSAGSDAAVADASPDQPDADLTPDASTCPPECSSCAGDLCIIECNTDDACATPVVCPAGMPCQVRCTGMASCAGGVDCTDSTACTVICTQADACAGPLECGLGVCDITCSGTSSCTGGIDCSTSCACDTRCTGSNSCLPVPDCPGPPQCTESNDECSSQGGPCDQC